MRIHEILIESQLEQLEEGPKLDALGRFVGGAVRGAAKGIGAIAGGVVGAGTALKKGYQSGKSFVGDDPDPNKGRPGYDATTAAEPTTQPVAKPTDPTTPPVAKPTDPTTPLVAKPTDPTTPPAPSTTTPPSAAEINAAGPEGTAKAKDQTGAAGAALAKTDAVTDKQTATKAGETVFAQVKANIDKLDTKGKTNLLNLVKKSLATPAAATLDPRDTNKDGKVDATEKSIAKNQAKTAAAPKPGAEPGAAAFGNMAKTLTQEPTTTPAAATAAEPTAATPAATPPASTAATTAATTSKLTPDQQARQAALKDRLQSKPAAASGSGGFKGAVASAKAKGIATASKVNYGNALSEALAQRVAQHKQKMFETGLSQGTIGIFRK